MVGNKYAQDYEIVTQQDTRGRSSTKLQYHGKYYEVFFERGNIRHFRITSIIVLLIALVLHVGAGFINNPGMRHIFLMIPYVAILLPLYYLAAGILALPKSPSPYRRDQINLSFMRIRASSRYLTILLFAITIAEVAFLLTSPGGIDVRLEVPFLIMEAAAGASLAIYSCLQRKITIKIQDQE
jgi:hypothetical protein